MVFLLYDSALLMTQIILKVGSSLNDLPLVDVDYVDLFIVLGFALMGIVAIAIHGIPHRFPPPTCLNTYAYPRTWQNEGR